MSSYFVDIHILHTVPPSNVNRDDTGAPKSAIYGGVRRARVSSQAWKRATRARFAARLDAADLGVRTKRVVELVADELVRSHPEIAMEEAATRAAGVLTAAGLKVTAPRAKKDSAEPPGLPTTDYLIFLSQRQIQRMAELAAAEGKPSKRQAQEAMDRDHGIEVGLFGRMVADDKELSVDASVQVAHALSTHAVEIESDYFTAVDDQTPSDESGAGMIGTIEFDSATYYRYATINVAGLRANLGDDEATARAVDAFIRDFSLSMPTGKQNTFAHGTLPDGVVVMLREGQPVNLVGAFEQPVAPRPGEGRVAASAQRLATYARSTSAFAAEPELTAVATSGERADALHQLGSLMGLDEAAVAVADRLRSSLGDQ